MATGGWPVYQYVQAKLDDLGWDSEEVFAGLPRLTEGHLTYSLIRRDRSGREEEPVKLTVAGMAHLPRFDSTVEMFLRVVNALGDRRAAAPFEPGRVVQVEISGSELVNDLGLDDEPLVGLLPELLQGEPATWHGSQSSDKAVWTYLPSSQLRRFRGIRDINDYVSRMRAWIMPAGARPCARGGLTAGRRGRVRLSGRGVAAEIRRQAGARAQSGTRRPADPPSLHPGRV